MSTIDFIFVPSGEVDGLVQLRSKKGLAPVSGVRVSLVDKLGTVVATATSEQSGYFLFKKVKGGKYAVRLAEREAERLDVYQENSAELVMPLDGDMLSNNDLIISRHGLQPSAISSPHALSPPSKQLVPVKTENSSIPTAVPQLPKRVEPPRVEQIRLLAEAGDSKAQKALGWIYSKGKEVSADKQEAVKWYRRAADKGEVDAQMALGWLYFSGDGVNRNLKEAAFWYGKAAAQGNTKAKKMLRLIRLNKSK